MKRIILTIAMVIAFALTATGCTDDFFTDTIESTTNTRADQTVDADSSTILIYMIGSDLESEGGCGTTDLLEMIDADLGKNINVIVQTGGAKSWNNNIMSGSKVERFKVEEDGIAKLETVGKCKDVSMVSANTLSDFLSWGMRKYPADRYGVILWDHGGGSITGYGYDEYHPDKMLGIDGIRKAFKKANAKVDFVGFDACLMGTIETAYALHDYADYMIASEETEPGSGWDYQEWLTAIAADPGISMKELAKVLIGDFTNGDDASVWSDMTLALYDLKDADKAYEELGNYLKESRYVLANNGFNTIANARLQTRGYGDEGFEQIDIRSYMDKAGVEGSGLSRILEDMIVYYQGNISDSTGMAMYYPYMYLSYYSDMTKVMDNIGMKNKYHRGYFDDFVSVLVRGKLVEVDEETAKDTIAEQLTGEEFAVDEPKEDAEAIEEYQEEDWYDEEAADEGYSDDAIFEPKGDLLFTETSNGYILDLTDEEWESIAKIESQLYFKDGNGYMFYGCDSLVDRDENNDLIAGDSLNWVTINGQFVPFYIIADNQYGDKWDATGYVPAILNAGTRAEKDVNIYIRWDSEHDKGYIMGYTQFKSDDDTITVANKNYLQFEADDTIDFYCEYYKENGKYDDSYYVGDTITVDDKGLEVKYEKLDEGSYQVGYHLIDKYGNEFWTEVLEF